MVQDFLTAIPAKTEIYFFAVYKYARKAGLDKDYWDRKRKLGVTMHFSEIITCYLQFRKKCHALLCILVLFRIIVA